MLYDLHLHSALSPCADNNMTPSTIVGMASLNGLEVIAITDHNSAKNLPAAKKAADYYNIKLLPGIEVCTAEEVHLLCYFPTIEIALEFSDIIYESLPNIPVDTSIWGEQLIMNEEDEVIGKMDKLLTLASGFDIYEITKMTENLSGIAVPAHIDKETNSLLSIMGFMPHDLNFKVVELMDSSKYPSYVEKGLLPNGLSIVTSSDAHSIEQLLAAGPHTLDSSNPIYTYIKNIYR